MAGRIQHSKQLAMRIENWRRGASQSNIAGEEVLVAMDDQWPPFEQAGPHPVGAL